MCLGDLVEDDADILLWRVHGFHHRSGQLADQCPELLGRAALGQGDLNEWHHVPPEMKMDPRLVKWKAVRVPGPAGNASVMPPVSTSCPASIALPRRPRSL